MRSLNNLIKSLSEDPLIKRYKELEKIIDNDQQLNKDYADLLNLQKIMVNKREKRSKDLNEAKKNYDLAKSNVEKHLILSEYLDLLEQVNYDLGLVQKIISEEVNTDFE